VASVTTLNTPTVASTDGRLSINMTTATVSIANNAVLIADSYVALTFGSAAAYRMNIGGGSANGGFLVFRNGGAMSYTGPVGHSFFNGYLNIWNGELTYQANSPGTAAARQDFFSPSTCSNGMSALSIVYSGAPAADAYWYTHLEPLFGKFGALKFINATSVATSGAAGSGINIQFGSGTYAGVSLPSRISTFGITQNVFVYLARSGGTTVLDRPTLPDSSLTITGDTAGSAQLIDETWPDLAAGTVGTVVRDATYPGSTTVTRIFRYNPGTLFAADPVFLRIANAAGTAAINGAVTSAAGINMPWQTYSSGTNVTTNLGPFSLVARRKDIEEITATFTPTAPITYNNPLALDSYYTTDASGQTGISAVNASTKTVTIDSGTTLTIDRRYDWLKWYLSQNLSVANFLAPSGTAMGYLSNWNDSIAGTSSAGTKLTSTSTGGTVTVTGAVSHPYQDSTGLRATITGLDPASLGTTWVLGYITTANYDARTPATAHATWTGWAQTSGTGNSTQETLAAATEYKLFLRIPGYFAPIGPIATINTATQSSVTLSPVVDTDITGALLWPQTVAHTTQAAKFTYNMTDQIVEYDNTTGAAEYISFLAAYRALETIAKAPAMAYQLIQPLYLNGTRDGFSLPRNNPLLARMTAASTAGAILQADISYADNQAAAFDRFRANSEHPHLLIPQASATVNASTIQAIQAGLATRAELVVINNGVKKASDFQRHQADLPA
jgi:hypothetical protein